MKQRGCPFVTFAASLPPQTQPHPPPKQLLASQRDAAGLREERRQYLSAVREKEEALEQSMAKERRSQAEVDSLRWNQQWYSEWLCMCRCKQIHIMSEDVTNLVQEPQMIKFGT